MVAPTVPPAGDRVRERIDHRALCLQPGPSQPSGAPQAQQTEGPDGPDQPIPGPEISQQTLLDDGPVPGLWIDTKDGPPIERAAATRTGRVFLSFSRFPAADVETQRSGETVVRFIDLRFMGTPLRLEARPQARVPSAITIWLDGSGRVLAEHLGG